MEATRWAHCLPLVPRPPLARAASTSVPLDAASGSVVVAALALVHKPQQLASLFTQISSQGTCDVHNLSQKYAPRQHSQGMPIAESRRRAELVLALWSAARRTAHMNPIVAGSAMRAASSLAVSPGPGQHPVPDGLLQVLPEAAAVIHGAGGAVPMQALGVAANALKACSASLPASVLTQCATALAGTVLQLHSAGRAPELGSKLASQLAIVVAVAKLRDRRALHALFSACAGKLGTVEPVVMRQLCFAMDRSGVYHVPLLRAFGSKLVHSSLAQQPPGTLVQVCTALARAGDAQCSELAGQVLACLAHQQPQAAWSVPDSVSLLWTAARASDVSPAVASHAVAQFEAALASVAVRDAHIPAHTCSTALAALAALAPARNPRTTAGPSSQDEWSPVHAMAARAASQLCARLDSCYHQLPPRHAAMCVYNLGKLRQPGCHSLAAGLLGVCSARSAQMSLQDTANALSGAAALGVAKEAPYHELADAFFARPDHSKPGELAAVTQALWASRAGAQWALARVPSILVRRLAAGLPALQSAGKAEPNERAHVPMTELAMCLQVLVEAGVQDDLSVALDAAAVELAARMSSLSLPDAVNLLWAYTFSLRFEPGVLRTLLGTVAAQAPRMAGLGPQYWVRLHGALCMLDSASQLWGVADIVPSQLRVRAMQVAADVAAANAASAQALLQRVLCPGDAALPLPAIPGAQGVCAEDGGAQPPGTVCTTLHPLGGTGYCGHSSLDARALRVQVAHALLHQGVSWDWPPREHSATTAAHVHAQEMQHAVAVGLAKSAPRGESPSAQEVSAPPMTRLLRLLTGVATAPEASGAPMAARHSAHAALLQAAAEGRLAHALSALSRAHSDASQAVAEAVQSRRPTPLPLADHGALWPGEPGMLVQFVSEAAVVLDWADPAARHGITLHGYEAYVPLSSRQQKRVQRALVNAMCAGLREAGQVAHFQLPEPEQAAAQRECTRAAIQAALAQGTADLHGMHTLAPVSAASQLALEAVGWKLVPVQYWEWLLIGATQRAAESAWMSGIRAGVNVRLDRVMPEPELRALAQSCLGEAAAASTPTTWQAAWLTDRARQIWR